MSYCIPLLLALLTLSSCATFGPRDAVVTAPEKSNKVLLLDFSRPMRLSNVPESWYHYTFNTVDPMIVRVFPDQRTLRCTTNNSASILIRHVDIPIDRLPMLIWKWRVLKPFTTQSDERTRLGDDSPARLFLVFETDDGESRSMEIIWGHQLGRGDTKEIEGFPHYVARGPKDGVNVWKPEAIDMEKLAYETWADRKTKRLMEIGIFCDTDNTKLSSEADFSQVFAIQRPDPKVKPKSQPKKPVMSPGKGGKVPVKSMPRKGGNTIKSGS